MSTGRSVVTVGGMETLEPLVAQVAALRSAVVAFSGGADSTLVAWVATKALGGRALAVTARSESLAPAEAESARDLAERIGIAHEEVSYSELAVSGYADNPPDRCYLCKGELFRRLQLRAASGGYAAVLDGSNADDLDDYRPGRRAALELGVRSPLAELGWRKDDIRAALRQLGLPVWDKPSSPCLSSRVPYGEVITREKLEQIGKAEAALRELGFRDLRVRHHGTVARVELPREALARAVSDGLAEEIVRRVRSAGFAFVALDLEGLRSGSLNRLLPTR
jgi:uncharacterized protein